MDHLAKFRRQLSSQIITAAVAPLLITCAVWFLCAALLDMSSETSLAISLMLGGVVAGILALRTAKRASMTVESIADSVSYVTHRGNQAAPNTDKVQLGRELVQALSSQIYDIASSNQTGNSSSAKQPSPMQVLTPSVLDHVSMPIVGLDNDQRVTAANSSAIEYFGVEAGELIGKRLYDVAKLRFRTETTLEAWMNDVKDQAVTNVHIWERVRLVGESDETLKQFDLIANYSQEHSSGTDVVIALYDRSAQYDQDDREISFLALAVHELRTPMTILRGYIEVFEDELGPELNPEMQQFMHKMHASAQQLTAFVGNILNVARVEENQLAVKLRREPWIDILKKSIGDLELRAQVHGKHIELRAADNIPDVAADRISVQQIINNLLDNAIKYSEGEQATIITVSTKVNEQGLVETSVSDKGIGVPAAVMPDLFQKFHRSHKSRVQIGGTGLGLYLCKALVSAHGGNIWVQSKEGEGATFTFTLMPFDTLSAEEVAQEDGIVRGAHGWIKNHSMHRR